MALLKFKAPNGWKVLYSGILNAMLRKNNNLSDLTNVDAALENLGLTGEVTTHSHPAADISSLVKKSGDTMTGALSFGDNIKVGDHNIGGHLCVQGINNETGLLCKEAGVDMMVSATYLHSNLQENIKILKNLEVSQMWDFLFF